MIIAGIEAIPLRIPFKAGTKSDASAWGDSNLPAADSLLVKVTTDQGLTGWGEAFGFRAVASAKLAIDQLIAPLCVGQNATRIGPLMLDVQKKLHVFGRAGALAVSLRSISPFGISLARPPSDRCASFRAAARPISPVMRAWSVIPIPPLFVAACGKRSTPASAHSSFMKLICRRSALLARKRGLISS